jgi:hypothetical protein
MRASLPVPAATTTLVLSTMQRPAAPPKVVSARVRKLFA